MQTPPECGLGDFPETITRLGANLMCEQPKPKIAPGVCIPWEEKRKEFPEITGDEQIVKRTWEEVDGLAYTYIWQVLVSF